MEVMRSSLRMRRSTYCAYRLAGRLRDDLTGDRPPEVRVLQLGFRGKGGLLLSPARRSYPIAEANPRWPSGNPANPRGRPARCVMRCRIVAAGSSGNGSFLEDPGRYALDRVVQ